MAGLVAKGLALSSGYATPLWPPAGIALAALLIGGARCWPGIWLGAFLLNLFLNISFSGAAIAALIASGASLQAVVGEKLTRSLFGAATPLARPADAWRFLLLAGPLSCLVSATVGISTLIGFGRLATPAVPQQWLLWLTGDMLGVMLFAPLALLVWPNVRPLWMKSRLSMTLSLMLTAALLTAGGLGLSRIEESRSQVEVVIKAEEAYVTAMRLLQPRIDSLHFVERYMASRQSVSQQEFSDFTASLQNTSGTVIVGWVQRITQRERAVFEAALRREVAADAQITEQAADGSLGRAGTRATYYPVIFAEPAAVNHSAIGFDYDSEPKRHAAMAQARDTGTLVVTSVIPLVHAKRSSVIVLAPHYAPGFDVGAASVEARRAALRGFAVGAYHPEALFAPIAEVATARQLQFRITDVTAGETAQELINTLPASSVPSWSRQIPFGNRLWRLDIQSALPIWQVGTSIESRIYLAFSVLVAFLVALMTLVNAGRRALTQAEVVERTAELERELVTRRAAEAALQESEERYRQLIELAPYSVFVQDQGCFAFVNPKGVAMFGAHSASELLGRRMLDFVHPDSHDAISQRVHRLAVERVPVPPGEAQWLRLDGSAFYGEASSAPCNYDHRPGFLTVLQDITARKLAEDQRDRIFNLSRDLQCIADMDGYFKRVNPAFTQTLGWSENEFLTQSFLDFVHPDDIESTQQEMRNLATGITLPNFKNRYRCKDGSWRWLEWKTVVQTDGLSYATARDVTLQYEFEQELRRLNTELKMHIEERGAALDALQASKEQVRAIADNLLECVITIDARGTVQSANPALERLLGYTADEVIGCNVSMLMPEPHQSAHDGYLEHYLRTGEARIIGTNREVEGRHKDGSLIPLELAINEYTSHGERFFIGSLRDIREHKQLIAHLTQARIDAEAANRAKSSFLATMSHEIRTPMNGVIGLVDVLTHSKLPESEADMVRTIRHSAFSLLGIIDDILDFSKIEAGHLELERKPVSIAAITEGICSTLSAVALDKSVDLSVFVSPHIPERVLSDELRLRQVLYNLIGNAIKFSGGTPERRGRVTVRVELDAVAPMRLAVVVADNGIGIAPEALPRLFQAFSQADVATTRRFGGTGLGLAISKRLINLMEGHIDVTSTPGHGATFIVNMPFDAAAEQPPRSTPDLSGLACIVVNSTALNPDDLRIYLEHAGATVHLAADEASAARMAAELPMPAVVVHDAAHQRLAPTVVPPAFMAVANTHHLQLQRGQRRRARLEAPNIVAMDIDRLRWHALLEAVAVAAGRHSPEIFHDTQILPAEPVMALPPTIPEARAQGRLILVAEDDDINQKVILKQLELLGYAAEIANNGIKALNLWRVGRYALLLTDLNMPEMDGYVLAETIRREESGGARLPILAITANALRGEEMHAYAAGMDDYLTKPVQLNLLRAALEKWLPPYVSAPAVSLKQVTALATSTNAVDITVLEALVGDDPLVVREFLIEYQALAQRQSGELRSAWAAGDVRHVGAIAHRLKSSSRSVGAIVLGDECAQLENACKVHNEALIKQGVLKFDLAMVAVVTAIGTLLTAT